MDWTVQFGCTMLSYEPLTKSVSNECDSMQEEVGLVKRSVTNPRTENTRKRQQSL
jgi:hypothetical protein